MDCEVEKVHAFQTISYTLKLNLKTQRAYMMADLLLLPGGLHTPHVLVALLGTLAGRLGALQRLAAAGHAVVLPALDCSLGILARLQVPRRP